MCDYRVTDNIQHTQLGILHEYCSLQACKTVNLALVRPVPVSVPYTELASSVSVLVSKWWTGTFDVLVITHGWQVV